MRAAAIEVYRQTHGMVDRQTAGTLLAHLGTEQDPRTAFLISKWLCEPRWVPLAPLLTHKNPAARAGALFTLANRHGRPFTRYERKLLEKRISEESDPVCRYYLGSVLESRWHDPRCIGLWIAVLGEVREPIRPYEGSPARPIREQSYVELLYAVKPPLQTTDEEDALVRQGKADRYAGVASRYTEWWRQNGSRLSWNKKEQRFVVKR